MRHAVAMIVDADDFVAGARARGRRWAAAQVAKCSAEISAAGVEFVHEPPDAWVVTVPGNDRDQAVTLAHELRERIRRHTELTVTIAVGEPAGDVAAARAEAARTAARKLLLGDGDGDRVIAPAQKVLAASGPAVRIEPMLAACLRRGDRRAAVEVLIRWVERCAAQPGATPEALRHWLIAALLGATEAAGARRQADGSVDWTGIPLVELFEVAQIHERSYLRLWLEGLMTRLIGEQPAPNDPLDLVIAHINRHFDDPTLRLETVAAAVSVSPYYISHLFRRQRGETFLRYLTGCRLAHARALLTGTTLTVEQIAGRSGYASAKRFRIVFKRHLGCPPAEFRRRNLR